MFYITTPIYYVNDDPHIGHAYTTLVADFIARWHRLHGRDVFFLTGTDEHGSKIAKAAAEKNLTPKQHCDEIVPRWKAVWERLQISNDDFIRTTDQRHKATVDAFMNKLKATDDIYLGHYEGPYCVRCEEYKTEAQLEGDNCKIHGTPVELLQEENWFFRLSAYTERLKELYAEQPSFVKPQRARNELEGLLNEGLRDIPISRPSVEWGIPLPWQPDHVIYVWIEALQNYLTVGLENNIWPADVHLVGKEIVRFHAVIWPAMLMCAGYELPKRVFAHGWLLVGGEKISKSGKSLTQISPHELVDTYGVDAYRYHFLRATNFGEDGNFSLEDLEARYNADLANDLGNLASRTSAMLGKYFDGRIPPRAQPDDLEHALIQTIELAKTESDKLVGDLRVTDAVAKVWEIVRHANKYLVEREPWKLARDDANRELVGTVLHAAANALAHAAALLWPAMPQAMQTLWTRLGLDGAPTPEVPELQGRTVTLGDALFPRLEK